MPNPLQYKKVASVYVRRDKLKASSGNSVIYNILDSLEQIARVIAAINRFIMGNQNSDYNKRRIRRIRKYAKINKTTGMLVLKKQKKATALKSLKPAKKWSPIKKLLMKYFI